jgi:zinc/manganese transport system ATP-binding protein
VTIPTAVVSATEVDVVVDGAPVLERVDLAVRAATVIALTGPNGAGKSTLLDVLAGLRVPTAGRVERAARRVAFVPQRAAVPDRLPVTVSDIAAIGLPRGRRGGRARQALDRVGMLPFARRRFSTLSGGQRQRALLAQALARRADLLLLDEPTTGLDTESSALIGRALGVERERGAAIVCATHDPRLIATADRVVRLEAGRLWE